MSIGCIESDERREQMRLDAEVQRDQTRTAELTLVLNKLSEEARESRKAAAQDNRELIQAMLAAMRGVPLPLQ